MEILRTSLVAATRFLNVFERVFTHRGKDHTWYFVSREEKPSLHESKKPDAVIMVGMMPATQKNDLVERLVLTEEFRVPIGAYELSFPAGLIDEGETPEQAAIREFKEETGMDFKPYYSSPPNLYSSAGMTNESLQIVFGIVTGEPSTALNQHSEDIRIRLEDQAAIKGLVDDPKLAFSAKAWPILMMYGATGRLH